jgi:hypothetical protein
VPAGEGAKVLVGSSTSAAWQGALALADHFRYLLLK